MESKTAINILKRLLYKGSAKIGYSSLNKSHLGDGVNIVIDLIKDAKTVRESKNSIDAMCRHQPGEWDSRMHRDIQHGIVLSRLLLLESKCDWWSEQAKDRLVKQYYS